MNMFQRISRDLVIEDLKRHEDLRSTTDCDPVTRQFIWQRLCRAQDSADGILQRKMNDEFEGNT